MRHLALLAAILVTMVTAGHAQEADDPELIFKKTTVWRMLSPDAKLATYALDDPLVEGVACHFTVPEIGGWKGWAGFAEERSEISLACRQIGPISFKAKFEQGEDMYRQRRGMGMIGGKRNDGVATLAGHDIGRGDPAHRLLGGHGGTSGLNHLRAV